MPQHIAFLRAINVGSHLIKMEALRAHFADLGLANPRSFIASGNIVFESAGKPAALEARIEKHLAAKLAYEVDTFLRSPAELAAIVAHADQRFAEVLAQGANLYIGFLRAAPDAAHQRQTQALSNEVDVFSFHGRELYWLCHKSMAETTIAGPKLAKALGGSTTTRNILSLRKLLATFSKSGSK